MIASTLGAFACAILSQTAPPPAEWSLDLVFDSSIERDDNLFLAGDDQTSRTAAALRPSATLRYERESMLVTADYRPTAYVDFDDDALNELFHDASIGFRGGSEHLKVEALAGYFAEVQRLGVPEDLRSDLLQRLTFDIKPYYERKEGETRFRLGGHAAVTDIDDDAKTLLEDLPGAITDTGSYRQYGGFAQFDWQASPKVRSRTSATLERTDFRTDVPVGIGAGDTTALEARTGLVWTPRWRVEIEGFAGARALRFDHSDDTTTAIVGATGSFKIGRTTEARIDATRQVLADVFGNPIIDRRGSAQLSWAPRPEWDLAARAWLDQYNYAGDEQADDRYLGGELRVEYRPTDEIALHAGYSWHENAGDLASNDYTLRRGIIGLTLRLGVPRERRREERSGHTDRRVGITPPLGAGWILIARTDPPPSRSDPAAPRRAEVGPVTVDETVALPRRRPGPVESPPSAGVDAPPNAPLIAALRQPVASGR